MHQNLFGPFSALKSTGSRIEAVANWLLMRLHRVLLTRSMKGCYVTFLDKNTEHPFRSRMESTGNHNEPSKQHAGDSGICGTDFWSSRPRPRRKDSRNAGNHDHGSSNNETWALGSVHQRRATAEWFGGDPKHSLKFWHGNQNIYGDTQVREFLPDILSI
jgi:hypothetical protein